ncbi:MAG: phosphoribosyltransferase [Elusimicrobia bacterium]|nr:phosphoribosyltransferase [Elusimicrobiota bacterium]
MFRDRKAAGVELGKKLLAYRDRPGALVLGVPRGGVIVAAEVALALELPLDVFLARKLRAPGERECGYGAVTELGNVFIDPALACAAGAGERDRSRELQLQRQEIDWQRRLYRGTRGLPPVKGRFILLVDDGIATGSTTLAAVEGLRAAGAKEILVAAPVGEVDALLRIASEADGCEVLETARDFRAVSEHYREFLPVANVEVLACLSGGHPQRRAPSPSPW